MRSVPVFFVLALCAAGARGDWNDLVGDPAPALGVSEWARPPEGLTLDELRGRPIVVSFFAPSSPVTLAALPRLHEIRAIYSAKGLRVPEAELLGLEPSRAA